MVASPSARLRVYLATGIDLGRGRRAAACEGPQFVSEPARPSQAAPRACRLQACLATKSTSVEVVRAAASGGEGPQFVSEPARPSQAALRACRLEACFATGIDLARGRQPTAAPWRRAASRVPQVRSCVPSAGCVPRIQVGCNATAGRTTQRYEPGADFPTFRGLFSPGAPRRPRKV